MLYKAYPGTLIIQLLIAIINHVSVCVALVILMLQEIIENNVGIDSVTEISYRNSKTWGLNKEPPVSQCGDA